jgi:hypothetical protein
LQFRRAVPRQHKQAGRISPFGEDSWKLIHRAFARQNARIDHTVPAWLQNE